MAKINVVDLGGKKVGEFELLDEVFSGEINDGAAVGVGEALPRRAAPGHGVDQDPRPGFGRRPQAVEAEGHRPRANRVDPQPAVARRRYGPRTEAAQLRVRVPAEEADGRAALGDCGKDCGREADGGGIVRRGGPKTKLFRTALDKLEAGKTTLLVESSQKLGENLYLGTRNLEGVELVLSSEVHPYDLLRYEHAVFSKDALEALQETLKKFVSKRSKHAQKEVA